MGRAIDMEKDIDVLKLKLEKLENTVRGMVSKLDELNEKGTKTKHVDLTEVKNEKEETNNEGDDSSSKQSNKGSRKSKSKGK
jgi:predicted transcriptional regulator